VRKIFAVSGIKDVIAKQHGAPNGVTNARVTMKALKALKPLSQIKSFAKASVTTDSTPSDTPAPKKAPAKKPTAPKKAPAKKTAE